MSNGWTRLRRILPAVVLFCVTSGAHAAMQSRVADDTFAPLSSPLAVGRRVRIERVPIADQLESLDLERVEVWAPGAEVVIFSDGGKVTREAPMDARFFRGRVAGDDDSIAFIGMVGGRIHGLVLKGDRQYTIARQRATEKQRARGVRDSIYVEEVSAADEASLSSGGFSCGVEGRSDVLKRRSLEAQSSAKLEATTNAALATGTATWVLNVAIETDFELYQNAGNSVVNVQTFVANLVGAASTIYQRDLQTEIRISSLTINSSISDPFTVAGSDQFGALLEFGTRWHNSPPSANPRSAAALLSGKFPTAGIAWVDEICRSGDFLFDGPPNRYGGGYSYNGGIAPPGDLSVPNPDANVNYVAPSSNYWPLLEFSHEFGHNVQSGHTHCIPLTGSDLTTFGRNFVDLCRSGEDVTCYSGAQSVPTEKGTIMSYCHLLGGGSQTRFTFGKTGEASHVVPENMRTRISSKTPALSIITAPATLNASTAGAASVTNVGGITYAWTITNGVINSGATTNAINFTVGASGTTTVRVTATNSTGCSVSDSQAVTINTCGPPVFTSVTESVAITQGGGISLNAAASNATSFQWYVGTSGDTTSPAAVGNPIAASPTTTRSYWVRATGPCGTTDSATITVTVVPPSTTNTSFFTVTPCRVIDTRNAVGPLGGPAAVAGATRAITVTGTCGIPAGVKAISINLTAVGPSANGWFTLFPGGGLLPSSSTMNYRTGKTRANGAVVNLSPGGVLNVFNSGPNAVNFIIDVNGYFN